MTSEKKSGGKSAYPQNIEFSLRSIEYFRNNANEIQETESYIEFKWYEIPEENLPPLIVKIRENKGKYYLQYLKELGEDRTIIKGKQRKGKNKNGKIQVEKEEER